MTMEQEAEKQKLINQEYKIWKKNSPYLYDLVVTHALEWPTLTLQWLPDVESKPDKDYSTHRMIMGTHTSEGAPNYLQIVSCMLPNANSQVKYDDTTGEVGGYGNAQSKIQVTQRIPHDGEVNRARYMPQNPCLIATRSVTGSVLVFDYTKHPLQPASDVAQPDITLTGHQKEGYGLSWNALRQGHVISSSEEICHWDINSYTKDNKTIAPLKTYTGHQGIIEDVAWHSLHDSLFASVGHDRKMFIWDTRKEASTHSIVAHDSEVNSVEFNPFYEYVLCTASSDKTLKLWDLRNLANPLHTLSGHTDEVMQLAWSPHDQTVLASSGADRRIHVWDLSRIGEELSDEDLADGPPELMFIHGGHTSKISDLSWNLNDPFVLGSAAEDNIVQVWQMATSIFASEQSVSSAMVE